MNELVEVLNQYLETWNQDLSRDNVVFTLSRISELIEKETEVFLKMDPDPFDDRHPSRCKPSCSLGNLLKCLFKNDEFMNKLVNEYLMNRNDKDLQVLSCRLVLNILPGLETSVVFNDTEGLIEKLFSWALADEEPLQSYATGLLAAAMEVQDLAIHTKEKNCELIPIMLKKLKFLKEEDRKIEKINEKENSVFNELIIQSPVKKRRISSPPNDCSNSSWIEMETFLIGSSKIYPLTNKMSQRFIFQYLSSIGEYQELLSFFFEHNVLSLIMETIDLINNNDIRLTFDALKYLASLVCHKKFALEFVNCGGIQALLKVYQQSLASTGVSLCLNCIAHHDDVMEKICLLPRYILDDLVSYALWLIERSHDSSRTNAMIFFSLTFSYRIILELFDKQDGLRKILNEISMIDLFSTNALYSEDEIFTKRQYAKHICFALKRYFETHLIILAQKSVNLNSSTSNGLQLIDLSHLPPYKPINYDYDLIMDHIEAMLHLFLLRCQWEPLDQLIKYGGAKLMIQYINMSYDWNFFGKADAIRSALDVLVVCSVIPKFQLILTEPVNKDEGSSINGIRIILAAAGGELINDPECQKSALNVLINCVCGPLNRVIGINLPRTSLVNTSNSKKKLFKCNEDYLNKLWNCVRFNNGIMFVINLLMTKTPITDADSIRALSCKALCGLARSENVKQVICKLPLFASGQIQTLMKEPILQDKRSEHLKFCKYCIELIERVTGTAVSNSLEASIRNLNKAEVITRTKIIFNEQELLKLIHNHLIQKGFKKTATLLLEEARISENNQIKNALKFFTPKKTLTPRMSSRQISLTSPLNFNNSPSVSSLISNSTSNNSGIPVRINRINKSNLSSKINNLNNRRHSFNFNTPMAKMKTELKTENSISLDSIVIEYLRKQHSLCKNPVVTCPPFDLFQPHRCPEPMNRNLAPVNITSRLIRKQYYPPYGGLYGAKMNRKYINSRFRSYRSLKCFDSTIFLNCAFAHHSDMIYIGADNGEIHLFNYQTGEIDNTFFCYDSIISHIEPSRDDKMLLTTTYWDQPNSILWSLSENNLEEKLAFPHDNHVEFSKSIQDKILGTNGNIANLYDLKDGKLLRVFKDEDYGNNYTKNMATFHPSDNLILNDGVLWDQRTTEPVHKFDKLNETTNGVFHPNGQEIVSSSEIWDIKTFKLLKTVSGLSQSYIKFNQKGDVVYAIYEENNNEKLTDNQMTFTSSFRTFDGYDYSNIATIDVKRSINALTVDSNNRFIALIESVREDSIYNDNVVRVYEVGRSREEDDEERAGEDDESEDEETDEESFIDGILENDLDSASDLSMFSMTDHSDDSDSELSNDDDDVFYQLNN